MSEVQREATVDAIEVHFGKVFQLCYEKHSEDASLRKHKGRVVFRGNGVTDQSATAAVFQEVGSSACMLSAAKVADAIAAAPRNSGQQSDATQAYTQALMRGRIKTWIELPPEQWPKKWCNAKGQALYGKPVCELRLALYGHPLSGVYWEQFCTRGLLLCGFESIDEWEQCFYHKKIELFLIVYVDDCKLVGPAKNLDKGWKLAQQHVRLDEPTPLQKFLGCDHVLDRVQNNSHSQRETSARGHAERRNVGNKFEKYLIVCSQGKTPAQVQNLGRMT